MNVKPSPYEFLGPPLAMTRGNVTASVTDDCDTESCRAAAEIAPDSATATK